MGTSAECGDFRQMTSDKPYSSGIGVRPTTPADTAEICDLLEHGFGIAADDWRPLYTTNWLADNPTRGFVVTDGGRIVGHVATIYLQREINGKTGIVCNFSGFYIAPAYRGRGLGATLVAAAVRDESITYTSLTPAPVTQRVMEARGLQSSTGKCCCSRRGSMPKPFGSRVSTSMSTIGRCVRRSGQAERRIYDDHASYGCLHMTARDAGGTAYLVVKRRLRRMTVGVGFRSPRYCIAARRTCLRATSNESSWRSCGDRRPSASR